MRDEFSAGVRDILAHRAGFRCSKPDCRASTAGPGAATNSRGSIGIAAHITAASPLGPRFDATLTSDERGSVTNGIWLCDNHAKEIDRDMERYSPDLLRAWKVHAEDVARAMLGRPLKSTGLDVAIDISLHRDSADGLFVVGETNLTDGCKVMCTLRAEGSPPIIDQAKGVVFERRLLLGPMYERGRALQQQWFEVEIASYFNGPWQQPPHVLAMAGENGSNLVGKLARALDPDLDDTYYALQLSQVCPAPPKGSDSALNNVEIASAIDAVKNARLYIEGKDARSTHSIKEVVQVYMTSPGLRELNGWSARLIAPGIVETEFSFWSGSFPKECRWHVIPRIGQVRARNRYAKMMSWLPAD